MAGSNSIEIDIIAEFTDNATDKVARLNAELDKLERRKVSVDVSVSDKATQMTSDIEKKLSRVDGSKATDVIDKVAERTDNIIDAKNEISIKADTSAAESALTGLESKINDIGKNATVDIPSPNTGDGFMLNGSWVPISGLSPGNSDNDAAEVIADVLTTGSEHNKGSRPVSVGNYDQSAMEAIEEYSSLKGQIAEYGIKLPPGADLETMRNAVFEYEDKHFTPETSTPHTNSKPKTTVADELGDAIGDTLEDNTDAVSKSAKQTADTGNLFKSMATRFIGATAVASGVVDSAEDILNAYTADNRIDSIRSRSHGIAKGGLMGAGALIGSIIPGVGTLFGAGAGALLGQLFGDDLGDLFTGLHKSAEELKQERLDEIFGQISMSAKDLSVIAKNMLGNSEQRILTATHQQSIQTGYSMQNDLLSDYYTLAESGGKLTIMSNMGIKRPNGSQNAYKTAAEKFMSDAKDTLAQSMYNAFMTNDDLFGYGKWDTTAITDKYKDAFDKLTENDKELQKYLSKALSDNNLTEDEIEHVNYVLHSTNETITDTSPSEGATKTDTYKFLGQTGFLSEDSYKSLIDELGTNYETELYDAAQKYSQRKANGASEKEAMDAFWEESNTATENYLSTALEQGRNMYAYDYKSALHDVWTGGEGKDTGNGYGLNMIGDSTSEYQANIKNANQYAQYDTFQARGAIQGASKLLSQSFDNVDDTSSLVLGHAYESLKPKLEQTESIARREILSGGDPSQYLDEMMGLYQIGALGGDSSAKAKYMAMSMFGDEETRTAMSATFGGDFDTMAYSFKDILGGEESAKDFANMWKLLSGSGGAEEIKKQSEENQEALDKMGEDTAKAASDAANTASDAMKEGNDQAADAAKDGAEKMKDATEDAAKDVSDNAEKAAKDETDDIGKNLLEAVSESLTNMDDASLKDIKIGDSLMKSIGESLTPENLDFKELGFGKNLMGAISESLSSENMDFKELGFGKSLMDAISESLTAENMDFKELGFGENLMGAIRESLSTENMDFKDLGFGESLLSAISESLSLDNMDFSDLSIGESLMNAVSESISADNIDLGELDIGSRIMDSINTSLESVDFSSVNIGESIMSGISASMDSIDLGEINIASKIMESINASLEGIETVTVNMTVSPGNIDTTGVEAAITSSISAITATSTANMVVNGTVNYQLGEYPANVPGAEGIANYNLGTSPATVPDASGIANYTLGSYPTSVPDVTGVVNYVLGSVASPSPTASVTIGGRATGGLVSRRELTWVGEEGPEAIIPLVPGRRDRGIDLWMQAGRALGVMEHAEGGIVGGEAYINSSRTPAETSHDNTDDNSSSTTISAPSSDNSSVNVNMGGITIAITVDGNSRSNIVDEIRSHAGEIAEAMSDEMERHLSAIFLNS